MKYSVIVFGNLPIATKIIMYLQKQDKIELKGVVISDQNPHNNDPWKDVPCTYEYCKREEIPTYTLEEFTRCFANQTMVLGLSCRFGKIIKKDVIDMFSKGIINMHGGLLPEFAGLYSSNFSVLYGAKKGGGTLHYIDEGIDTGDIIRRCEFPIEENDTGYTVFQKTQITLYKNMIEIIPLILNGDKIETYSMKEYLDMGYEHHYFNKRSIYQYKEINLETMNDKEILQRVKAFDFPGYEPAYTIIDGKRIYLRMN